MTGEIVEIVLVGPPHELNEAIVLFSTRIDGVDATDVGAFMRLVAPDVNGMEWVRDGFQAGWMWDGFEDINGDAGNVHVEASRLPGFILADNVYVLDPCCGTGAYLAEVLRRIAANLQDRGLGALTGAHVKRAATGRVFGFEIMPAPFVVAHLQVGLTMQALDAPLADDGDERAGVFLTNALTGWEPSVQKPLPFPELEEERDRAERVKQDSPILVILGNPPYNGFAGMAVDEERELSTAYRTTRRVRRPEGQGLNPGFPILSSCRVRHLT